MVDLPVCRKLFAVVYFSLANASLILAHALSILVILLAKEKRTQLGSPKASPITEDTCAVFSKYILKSAALAMVCVPPQESGGVMHDLLQSRIPLVECARLEGVALHAHYRQLQEQAQRYRVTVIYGAGWNPGILPWLNTAFHVLIPRGRSVAHRHPGVQMHHSLSVSQVPGVKDALEGEYKNSEGQWLRYVYVELTQGASFDSVRNIILSDPLYAGETTQVFQLQGRNALAEQEGQGLVLERMESGHAGHHASLVLEARFDIYPFAARAMVDAAQSLKFLKHGAHPYCMSTRPHDLSIPM